MTLFFTGATTVGREATTIEDYDISAALTAPFVSLRAGYRWLEAGDSSLNGPYIGVRIHF
jgi:hypothetical protein